MSQIDITVDFQHPDVTSIAVKYARIDNIPNPVFTTIPNVSVSPFSFTVPDGQYEVIGIPSYPDGRTCQGQTLSTPACPNIISLSAIQQGNNLAVQYTAGPSAVQVLVNVTYPNGGTFQYTYTNGNAIAIPLPLNVFGDFTVTMQAVCDPNTDVGQPPFMSPPTAPVTVTVPATQNTPALAGTVTVICNGDCSAQVNGALQFNLTAPLSTPLVMNLAYELTTPSGQQQYGCNLIPSGDLEGTCTYGGYATFTIPAGQLQYTTPQLFFAPSPGFGSGMIGLICFCGSNPDVTTIFINKLFMNVANAPGLTVNLTPTDGRITVIQV